jgi:hypothetical protein
MTDQELKAVVVAIEENLRTLYAAIDTLRVKNARLRKVLVGLIAACDQGRPLEKGAGGMTVEAQIKRTVLNGVPAWPVEEARAALNEQETKS